MKPESNDVRMVLFHERLTKVNTRRDFFQACGSWFCRCLVCTFGLFACKQQSQNRPPLSLGAVSSYAKGFHDKSLLRVRILHLVRNSQHVFSAVSLVCPHQGCLVRADGVGFVCPCHGARFSKDGEVLRGPAQRDLRWLELSLSDSGELFVSLDKEVSKEWSLIVDQSYFSTAMAQ